MRGTPKQTEAFYGLLKAICSGEDVPPKHILRKLKLGPKSVGTIEGVWDVCVPQLRAEVGNWEYPLKQTYYAFTHSGGKCAARRGIAVMSIYGEDLVTLIRSHPEDTQYFEWCDDYS